MGAEETVINEELKVSQQTNEDEVNVMPDLESRVKKLERGASGMGCYQKGVRALNANLRARRRRLAAIHPWDDAGQGRGWPSFAGPTATAITIPPTRTSL